jgi:oligopeptide/dipeptide ABC transporter ATP-binding protein
MYKGTIVEHAQIDELIEETAHPYTMMLIEAVPDIGRALAKKKNGFPPIKEKTRIDEELKAECKESVERSCVFYQRCLFCKELCKKEQPALHRIGSSSHEVACHFAEELYKNK